MMQTALRKSTPHFLARLGGSLIFKKKVAGNVFAMLGAGSGFLVFAEVGRIIMQKVRRKFAPHFLARVGTINIIVTLLCANWGGECFLL